MDNAITFEVCRSINDSLEIGDEQDARDQLIGLLADIKNTNDPYTDLINHLIRKVGLFPYMQVETSSWQDQFAYEAFKVDVGDKTPKALHREQSRLLSGLFEGRDIAVSAPTSFGKSFVVDAFIAAKKPANVMIIVPTIALADETRRRLQKKFGKTYKLITTPEEALEDRNIFILPQERAIGYVDRIDRLDILIVDEFYKASQDFDKERAPTLLRAALKLMSKTDQRYYLAPNIADIKDSFFTRGMEFLPIDFNTVVLETFNLFDSIGRDEKKKGEELLRLLGSEPTKTLVYAGTYSGIDSISDLLLNERQAYKNKLLSSFSSWLSENYLSDWTLPQLVDRGIGIHNGRLHRSLSQIQIKLFELDEGLNTIVSTSSIIEGVNTWAEQVIVWSRKNGKSPLTDFAYKNVIGRSGRMFKHFIGKIYLLEEPPQPSEAQLELAIPDEIVNDQAWAGHETELNADQLKKLHAYNEEMLRLLGKDGIEEFYEEHDLRSSSVERILKVARELKENKKSWMGLAYLNSSKPDEWRSLLFRLARLVPGSVGATYTQFVYFVQTISQNWSMELPDLLIKLKEKDIDINMFFQMERIVTFNFSNLLQDVNSLQMRILNVGVDISPFIAQTSHAFLPRNVYYLEEYGLPRSISRRIHRSELIDLEDDDVPLDEVLQTLQEFGADEIMDRIEDPHSFDKFILDHFFDGL